MVDRPRMDRPYAEARLQTTRRPRTKVPMVYGHPLLRPRRPNEVCLTDIVFNRIAES
jgi:hypothetical protein